jgi:hypothetical protein
MKFLYSFLRVGLCFLSVRENLKILREDPNDFDELSTKRSKCAQTQAQEHRASDILMFWCLYGTMQLYENHVEKCIPLVTWIPGYELFKVFLLGIAAFPQLKVTKWIFIYIIVPAFEKFHFKPMLWRKKVKKKGKNGYYYEYSDEPMTQQEWLISILIYIVTAITVIVFPPVVVMLNKAKTHVRENEEKGKKEDSNFKSDEYESENDVSTTISSSNRHDHHNNCDNDLAIPPPPPPPPPHIPSPPSQVISPGAAVWSSPSNYAPRRRSPRIKNKSNSNGGGIMDDNFSSMKSSNNDKNVMNSENTNASTVNRESILDWLDADLLIDSFPSSSQITSKSLPSSLSLLDNGYIDKSKFRESIFNFDLHRPTSTGQHRIWFADMQLEREKKKDEEKVNKQSIGIERKRERYSDHVDGRGDEERIIRRSSGDNNCSDTSQKNRLSSSSLSPHHHYSSSSKSKRKHSSLPVSTQLSSLHTKMKLKSSIPVSSPKRTNEGNIHMKSRCDDSNSNNTNQKSIRIKAEKEKEKDEESKLALSPFITRRRKGK